MYMSTAYNALSLHLLESLCMRLRTSVSMQPENVLLFHQLKQVDTIWAYLEWQTQWAAALLAAGNSAGVFFVINKCGRGSSCAEQRAVAHFFTL